jgi:hypothetical protein
MGNKKNNKPSLQRSFHGNRHTLKRKPPETDADDRVTVSTCNDENDKPESASSTSSKKLRESIANNDFQGDCDDFFFIMNFKIMRGMIESYTCCPECKKQVIDFNYVSECKYGYAICFEMECQNCFWST